MRNILFLYWFYMGGNKDQEGMWFCFFKIKEEGKKRKNK